MKTSFKRALAGVATLVVATTLVPFLGAEPAFAAGTLSGPASVKTAGGGADLASGNSATTFTLRLPAGASCPGDSALGGYRWQTYIVPASVDPSTLTFDSNGPIPLGTGAGLRQPLYDTGASPVVNRQTANAVTAGGPGAIINIPDVTYSVFAPGDIPAGVYNIGIACTLGPASATQMKDYWNVQKTFTVNAGGGPAQVNWSVGAVPMAPVLNTVTAGDGQLTAAFTPVASTPPTTTFTATAQPQPSGTPVTATGGSTPIVVGGLTNGTTYSVTVTATNPVGTSAPSNAITGTPGAAPRPPVTNLTATPAGAGTINLSWTAPSGPAPAGYDITVTPSAGTLSYTFPNTTASFSGLTAGTLYTFTVTPTHATPPAATAASVQATPTAAEILIQDITVTRPVGALVLTQVCGAYGALPALPATANFGALPSLPAGTGPLTGPTTGAAPGGPVDPNYTNGEYPYPDDDVTGAPIPNYPTHCGIDLGVAKFVKSGSGAGQFFAASGRINQVTVVDTRDGDLGWNVGGSVSNFTSGPKSFSGAQLGWNPVKTSDTDPFTDSLGNNYDMTTAPGPEVVPNSLASGPNGLNTPHTLVSAAALAGSAPNFTGGLGIAVADARLKLLIPVTAMSGLYNAVLTISVL